MLIHMIGNAHIDPVWLWPWQAGADEAFATMASAADRCDEYPDFIFTRGEAWVYEQVERTSPELFSRIQEHVANGRWHITGGQYLQPDLNLPTSVGLHRQITRGQKYFTERFGISPKIGYNVDSFGHSACLPDILAEHGYTGYVFGRPGPHQVELPGNTFTWKGVAGGSVIGFRIVPTYVGNSTNLTGQVKIAIESTDDRIGHTMCFFGVGNHGGGPTKAMIEWIQENQQSFEGHELVFSTPERYFEAISEKIHVLPIVEFELQSTFPGCYSVMHDIKMTQRRNENLLIQAENVAGTFSTDELEFSVAMSRIDSAWDNLLFTEFHDILTGTSISSSWNSVRAMQGSALIEGERVIHELTRKWSLRELSSADEQQIVVINTDNEAYSGYIEAEPNLDFIEWGDRWICDESGKSVQFQEIQPESHQLVSRILFRADIGQRTGVNFRIVHDKPKSTDPTVPANPLTATVQKLTNERISISLNKNGIGKICFDGKNILGSGGLKIHLRNDFSDTWTFHSDRFAEQIVAHFSGEIWQIEEIGPLRVRAYLDGRVGNSRVRMTVSLNSGEPAVYINLEVNFDERYKLLQIPIELSAGPTSWMDGLAQGSVERGPSPTEWPFSRWSRLRVGDCDIGLVTDTFYSHSVNKNIWQPTLLRSPRMAWGGGNPRIYSGKNTHTDQGVHKFDFALHFGHKLSTSALCKLHRQAAQPLIIFDRYEGMDRPAWGQVPPRELWQEAMMRNVEEGLIEDPGVEHINEPFQIFDIGEDKL